MPHSLNPLVCFNSGEWSPSMDSRVDIPNYRKACRRLQNVVPTKQGSAGRRPGTQWIGSGMPYNPALSSAHLAVSRLEKFQFSPGTTYQLEFGDRGIRFKSNGQIVQVSSPPAWSNLGSYSTGQFVTYLGLPYYCLQNNADTQPNLFPSFWRQQSDYEIPSPYSGVNFTAPNYWSADVFVLKVKQINDVVYIVHPNFPVYKLTRLSDNPPQWTMTKVQFLTPALLDQNATDITIAAAATTGTTNLAATANAWATNTYYVPGNGVLQGGLIYSCNQPHTSGTFSTDLANGFWTLVTVFTSGNSNAGNGTGSYFQLAYNRPSSFVEVDAPGSGSYQFSAGASASLQLIGTWEVQTYGTWQADISIQASYDNGSTWQVIETLTSAGDANYDVSGQDIAGGLYRLVFANTASLASATPPRVVLTADNQFVYGLVQIVNVFGPYSASCSVITPLYSTSPTIFWSEGAWSVRRGYPQAITIFQERMWYGGSMFQPQRVWATQIDDLENFAIVDESQATYGLAFDLNAPGRGPIQWMNAQTDLFCGLAGAEWVLTSGQPNVAISATAIYALEHSANGSSPSTPGVVVGNAIFYVQRKGCSFQQMMFSVFTNKYMSQDMQVLSQHLANAGIKQFDYQQQFQNQSVLWAVCGDGTLISLTYAQDQEVFGWAKHYTGIDAGDLILSVQVIYGAAGADDEVWMSVLRNPATATSCQIERIYPVDWQTHNVGQPDLTQAVYADCATVFTSPGSNTFTGLPAALYNRPVVASIVPAGVSGMFAISGLTVSNSGAVTIPNYVPATGDTVVIGLAAPWYIQPMRLDVDLRAGPIPSIKKGIYKLYPRMLNSIGGNWATKEGQVTPLPVFPINQIPGQPPPFTPNIPIEVEVDAGGFMQYADDPQFTIQGTDPLPFVLLGITVKYDIEERI